MAVRRSKDRKNKLMNMGAALVEEFVQAVNNEILVLSLKNEAELNERNAIETITAANPYNSIYVTPEDIPLQQQNEIAKASVNAHMQKAQAIQTEAYNLNQQVAQTKLLREQYVGRKVTIKILNRDKKPVEGCWLDARDGSVKFTEWGPAKLSGKIENIELGGNALIIKPNKLTKSINKNLLYYRVYVVDPASLKPIIQVQLS